MQRLEVSGAVRPIYGSLGVKRFNVYQRFTFLQLKYLKNFSKTYTHGRLLPRLLTRIAHTKVINATLYRVEL